MKLTQEQKQKIKDYFESMSEEEMKEILKGHGMDVAKKESVEERPVGEIFEFEGTKLQVVIHPSSSCRGCYFYTLCKYDCEYQNAKGLGACDKRDRSDNNYVIFKEVND